MLSSTLRARRHDAARPPRADARSLARRDDRARQFRRLPPRPPGGRRRGGRVGARPRAARRSSPPSTRTRCATSRPDVAAVPPDHARPAQELFAAAGADGDAGVPLRRRAGRAPPPRTSSRELLAPRHRRGGRGDRRGLHLRQGARRQCRAAARAGRAAGIAARAVGPVLDGGVPVSSSRIRDALQGRRLRDRGAPADPPVRDPRRWSSTATSSAARSAIPTANLELGNYLRPRYGIYAVTGAAAGQRRGAARAPPTSACGPTFDPPKELLEPYFFDFAGDLYGQEIEVALPPLPAPRGEVRQPGRADARRCERATVRGRSARLLARTDPGSTAGAGPRVQRLPPSIALAPAPLRRAP